MKENARPGAPSRRAAAAPLTGLLPAPGPRLSSALTLALVPSPEPTRRPPSTASHAAWLLCLALGVAALGLTGRPAAPARPALKPATGPATAAGAAEHTLPTAGRASHHASHLTTTADGRPMCVWFAGSREGASDVVLLRSVFDGAGWSEPTAMLTPASASALTGRFVKKLGNAVTWRAPDGSLHLYAVTVALGGWAGSRIAHFVSDDDGVSFRSGDVLTLSPFFNFSTLVKGSALETRTESLLPVYHEFALMRPLLVSLDARGRIRETRTMGTTTGILQPALALTTDDRIVACLRSRRRSGLMTKTSADGHDWTEAAPSNLPNPNAAVALASTPEGRPVLAFNDSPRERNILGFAILDESGKWIRTPVRITAPVKEISYPTLLATPAGLHCAFTWERQKIVHRIIPWAQLTPAAATAP